MTWSTAIAPEVSSWSGRTCNRTHSIATGKKIGLSNSLSQVVMSRTPSQSGGRPYEGELPSKPHPDLIEKNQLDQLFTSVDLKH
jgi:hypothetical protein